MARLLKTDGTEVRVRPANGKKWQLHELQRHVGGYIERMPVRGLRMYVDEEGLLKGLPPNTLATQVVTAMLQRQGGHVPSGFGFVATVVGPAIIIEEGEGE